MPVSFEKPEYLYTLALGLVVALLLYGWRRWHHSLYARLGGTGPYTRLFGAFNRAVFRLRSGLFVGALLLLSLAAAHPRIRGKLPLSEAKRCDIVLALDVSASMLARDAPPSRMEHARYLASRLVKALPSDRFGLVVFAGYPINYAPISHDHAFLLGALQQVNPDWMTHQGSDLGEAIALASRTLGSGESEAARAIALISDGEDHEKKALAQAQKAAQEGIKIYTLTVGSARGSNIPLPEGAFSAYKTDENGEPVITRANEKLMCEIARATGGLCAQGTEGLPDLIQALEALPRSPSPTYTDEAWVSLHPIFLALALALLCIEWLFPFHKPHPLP